MQWILCEILCIFEAKCFIPENGDFAMPDTFLDSSIRILSCHYARNIYPWVQDHLHTPYWRFYWNPVPGGVLWINGERVPLMPNFFYLIPAYMEFSTRAEVPFEQFFIHFNLDDHLKPVREMHVLPADPATVELIRKFSREENRPSTALLVALTALAAVAPALLRLDHDLLMLPEDPDPRIDKVRKWIANHLDRRVDNGEMAKMAGMSCNGFCRLFRKEQGESPQNFVRKKRLELAGELLLQTDLTIDEISTRCGFSDRFHFSRVFRQVLNGTPAGFRKAVRPQEKFPLN